MIEEIIAPYVKDVRKRDKHPVDQKALLIMDVFNGQMTQAVLDTLRKEDIVLSRVPAGMTYIYQVLDLTVNSYAKRFMKKKCSEWYTNQVRQQLVEGKEVEQIEVRLTLTTSKPIHVKWLVDFYNHMTTPEGGQVISSGWSAGGITNALKNGETCLEPLDPFAGIDPLVSKPSVEQDDSNIIQIDEGLTQHMSPEDEKDCCDSKWELKDGNVFDVIAQEL